MQGTIQNYTLDMVDERKKEPLRVKQGDTNSRWARITLKAFGEPWLIPDDCLTFINVKKTDNTVVQNDCTIEGASVVLAPISEQVAAIAGIQQAELYFLAEDGDIRSQTFPIQVLPMVMDQDIAESSNEFGALQSALLDVKTATGAANDAAAEALIQADDAKNAAGLAVDAAASIDEAVQAAARAKTSETNAKASEAAAAQTKADVEALKEGFIGYDKTESGRRYANALTMTAEGEGQVLVTDAWDAPVVGMEIDGKSEQVATTGAQLFDLPNQSGNANGLSYIFKNGVVTVNGTPLSQYAGVYSAAINLTPGEYYVSGGEDVAGSLYTQVNITENDNTSKIYANRMLTVTGTEKAIRVVLQTGAYTTPVSYTFRPMINSGSTPLPWEPYTGGQPSPSPAYPQAIKGVEHVVNSGSQLLDVKLAPFTTMNGVAISLTADGGIRLNGTATGSGNHGVISPSQNIALNLDSATLSLRTNGDYNGVVTVSDASEKEWKTLLKAKNEATVTGTVKTNKLGCYVTYVAGTTYNVTLYPMLNKGNVALPWEPYNNQQRETDLQVAVTGKNLFNKEAVYSYNVNGVDIVQLDKGIRIYNTAARTYACAAVKVKLKPNTAYTYSCKIASPRTKSAVGIRKSLDNGNSFDPTMISSTGAVTTTQTISRTFTTDEKEYYAVCLLCTYDEEMSGDTTFENIQLEEGSKVTAWEPYYEPQSVAIPLDEPLRSIGDVRDKIVRKDGVWYIERNTRQSTFTGKSEEAWSEEIRDGVKRFFINVKANLPGGRRNIVSNRFYSCATGNNTGMGFAWADLLYLYADFESVTDFRLWLAANPTTVIHPLPAPVLTPFDSDTSAAINALATHPGTIYLTVASTDVAAPVRLEYVQDTRKVVDGLKLDLAEQMTELQAQIDQLKVTNNLA